MKLKSKRDVVAEIERVTGDISEADTTIQSLQEKLDTISHIDVED